MRRPAPITLLLRLCVPAAADRPSAVPVEALRVLRAIEDLEWAGTPEARGALDAVAKGPLPERFTQAAAAATQRAARRSRR
ncbi:MAG: hypothetical protein HZA54_06735 [Planctomycetes bacterium]|nr:hypothetical protein [Planctomycetota bacterium]